MLEVIGATLPYAAAIALSPLKIVAVIVLLVSPRSARMAPWFLAGWVAGIAVVTAAFTALASPLPGEGEPGAQQVFGIVQLVCGAVVFLLAVRQWRIRPEPGTVPEPPRWINRLEDLGRPAAFGLAAVLAIASPKNLLMSATASASFGYAGLDGLATVGAIGIFTALAAASVAAPVVFSVARPRTAAASLASLHSWLTANYAAISTVVLILTGTLLVGKGLENL